jgi:hypothetical protein
MKKNIKSHCRDIMLSIGAGSVLLTSCVQPYVVEEFTQSNFAKNEDIGQDLIPLDVYLSDEEMQYIQFIQSFAKDIFTYPELAAEFSKNPNSILEKYDVKGLDVDINNPEIQIALAFGDKEIVESIKDKNITKFLNLLEEKNLLQNSTTKLFNAIVKKGNLDGIDVVLPQSVFFAVTVAVLIAATAVIAVFVVVADDDEEDVIQSLTKEDKIISSGMNIFRLWKKVDPDEKTFVFPDDMQVRIKEVIKQFGEKKNLSNENIKEITSFALGTIEHSQK